MPEGVPFSTLLLAKNFEDGLAIFNYISKADGLLIDFTMYREHRAGLILLRMRSFPTVLFPFGDLFKLARVINFQV